MTPPDRSNDFTEAADRLGQTLEEIARERDRAHRALQEREIRRVGDAVHVFFEEPQRAVVKGQFAVFFQGDRVFGGGMIRAAARAPRPEPPVFAGGAEGLA